MKDDNYMIDRIEWPKIADCNVADLLGFRITKKTRGSHLVNVEAQHIQKVHVFSFMPILGKMTISNWLICGT